MIFTFIMRVVVAVDVEVVVVVVINDKFHFFWIQLNYLEAKGIVVLPRLILYIKAVSSYVKVTVRIKFNFHSISVLV